MSSPLTPLSSRPSEVPQSFVCMATVALTPVEGSVPDTLSFMDSKSSFAVLARTLGCSVSPPESPPPAAIAANGPPMISAAAAATM